MNFLNKIIIKNSYSLELSNIYKNGYLGNNYKNIISDNIRSLK